MKTDHAHPVREKVIKSAGGLLLGLVLGAALVSLPACSENRARTAPHQSQNSRY